MKRLQTLFSRRAKSVGLAVVALLAVPALTMATQPEAAEKTLIDLTTLLRAALKRTRTEQSTLADELAVITALLEINQIRMGDRLNWSVHIPEDLKSTPLPPMLLQPLVENAVKHGIEPLETGGSIDIQVEREDDTLVITIADTGAGLNQGKSTAGGGVGSISLRKSSKWAVNAS